MHVTNFDNSGNNYLSLKVIDEIGRIVYVRNNITQNDMELDLTTIQNGIYKILVTDNNGNSKNSSISIIN